MILRSLSPAGAPSSATVRRYEETAYCWKNMNCTLRADGACFDWGFCDTVCRHFDRCDIFMVLAFSLSAPVTDNYLVSAIEGLTLGAKEDTEMSEEVVIVDREEEMRSFTSPHEVDGGFMTPLRGTGDYIMAPSRSTPLAKAYITG